MMHQRRPYARAEDQVFNKQHRASLPPLAAKVAQQDDKRSVLHLGQKPQRVLRKSLKHAHQ